MEQFVYWAEVKQVGDQIEGEVVLSVRGIELTCFANVCPYEIQVGSSYPVSFRLFVIDDFQVEKAHERVARMERLGDGFKYRIVGQLVDGVVYTGLAFDDLGQDYSYLEGEYVSFVADRIDVWFLTAKDVDLATVDTQST